LDITDGWRNDHHGSSSLLSKAEDGTIARLKRKSMRLAFIAVRRDEAHSTTSIHRLDQRVLPQKFMEWQNNNNNNSCFTTTRLVKKQ
jgi:hypothetical protein